jgi:transcriptional regulator with XRE-family HTH domain
MKLSAKLRELRTKNNLTLKELSAKSGISVSFISDIENGRRNPSIETLKTLADALGVSADEFLKDSSNNTKSENTKPELNKKDLKDISKDVDSIMKKLNNGEAGPTYYNDIEMKEEDKELFRSALELALKTIKVKNKETYTPKKYKK